MFLVFAYGSNMSWQQMRARCLSARFVTVAELRDHRLAFRRHSPKRGCGVADAVPERGESVWGVVYEISDEDLRLLDHYEGFHGQGRRNGYTRRTQRVWAKEDGGVIEAQTYFATPDDDPPPPSEDYLRLLLEGARHWDLPGHYVARLQSLLGAQGGSSPGD